MSSARPEVHALIRGLVPLALLFPIGAEAADPVPSPVFADPYDLPTAPRPPTLPELTHGDVELTGESTFGFLHPNADAAMVRPANEVAYVQRLSLEWPIALRRFFVGATYELAAAEQPGGGPLEFISGNLDINGRTVWATSTGLAFGGGFGVTIPVSALDPGTFAAGAASAAATVRPWDQAFFQPGYLTLHPFFDVRDVDGPLVLQLRQGLDLNFDTHSWSGFRTAAITGVYIGYRAVRWLGVGIEAFEVYFLSGTIPDDHRAVFAISPSVRLMTDYVQPALSFVTNAGTPLFGSVDYWWSLRLAATVVWDRDRKELAPGQSR
jgi:hypothetical protein